MASLQTLERRIVALEARLDDIEGDYCDTLYKLRRSSVRANLGIVRILDHLQLEGVPDEAVDAAVDDA